jgi:hypothetical protein
MMRKFAFTLAGVFSLAICSWAQIPASTWQSAPRIEPGSSSSLPPLVEPAPTAPVVRLGLPRAAVETQPASGSNDVNKPIEAPPEGDSPAVTVPKVERTVTTVGYQDSSYDPVRSNLAPNASPYDPPAPFEPPTRAAADSYSAPPRTEGRSSAEEFFQGKPRRAAASMTSSSGNFVPTDDESQRSSSRFGERFVESVEDFADGLGRRSWITSDRCFDNFVSPVTNPFLAEDPRAVTEIRPIFMFQTIPNGNPNFLGGNAQWFGTQLRVAFNERLSLTINKLGAIAINPGAGAPQPGGFGFSEIHLGPKFTFWRDQRSKLIGAGGLIFQIPAGRASVYQDTGSLSLVPYLTVGKNFLPTSLGSFNAINTVGYSFGTDSQRTDFLYNSLHLDFDWMDRHRFYPLIEINWFAYTNSGAARPLGTEGADLANIGSTGVGGRHNLLIAAGMRFKFSERNQVGIAAEFPVINRRDMNNFRLTIDYIWRY